MADPAQAVDPLLLEVIVCPACHGTLVPRDDLLVCTACSLGYPIRDGVPVLLIDDAVTVHGPSGSAADGANGDDRA